MYSLQETESAAQAASSPPQGLTPVKSRRVCVDGLAAPGKAQLASARQQVYHRIPVRDSMKVDGVCTGRSSTGRGAILCLEMQV